ncbi:MAG: response regulator transcription factor [Dehalogenimonas sp.]|uniref:Response regulator transcription factor n=1 Tax=Candidatus Dehalogenimonas loeffleri TaxID=3127115 RepID=A0ABZ2J5J7_9CHLR|nr:response regulator transcription factor [Dehalogenimonas sp.]
MIKILIADDHAIVRNGLNNVLKDEPDMQVIGEACDGEETVRQALKLKPDVLLLDILMPQGGGLTALANIIDKLPTAKVLILTISDREDDLFKALRYGAHGYLLKEAGINEVVDAVRRIAAGEVILSSQMVANLVSEFRQKSHNGEELNLSSREMEVLRYVGEGCTNSEISAKLFISESTVRTYLRRLLEKLHLRNRSEAVAYATRHHVSFNHNP